MTQTLAAVFDRRDAAEQARQKLIAAGFGSERIRLNDTASDYSGRPATPTGTISAAEAARNDEGFVASIKHFFADLFGSHDDRYVYAEAVSRGHVVLTLEGASDAELDRASAALLATSLATSAAARRICRRPRGSSPPRKPFLAALPASAIQAARPALPAMCAAIRVPTACRTWLRTTTSTTAATGTVLIFQPARAMKTTIRPTAMAARWPTATLIAAVHGMTWNLTCAATGNIRIHSLAGTTSRLPYVTAGSA